MSARTVIAIVGSIAGIAIVYNSFQKRREDPPIFYRKKLKGNYNARTIPPFGIFIKESEKDNKALLEHELVHWKQYQEKGFIGFYNQYSNEMKEYGYDGMPMEKEARKNETEYCKDNYTECVRNGTSKTIHNPEFRT